MHMHQTPDNVLWCFPEEFLLGQGLHLPRDRGKNAFLHRKQRREVLSLLHSGTSSDHLQGARNSQRSSRCARNASINSYFSAARWAKRRRAEKSRPKLWQKWSRLKTPMIKGSRLISRARDDAMTALSASLFTENARSISFIICGPPYRSTSLS